MYLSLPSVRSRVCTPMPDVFWVLVTELKVHNLPTEFLAYFQQWYLCVWISYVSPVFISFPSLSPTTPSCGLCSRTLEATSQGLYFRDLIHAEMFHLQGPLQWGCTLKHVDFGKMLSVHSIHSSIQKTLLWSICAAYNTHVHMCIHTHMLTYVLIFLRQLLNIALSMAVL